MPDSKLTFKPDRHVKSIFFDASVFGFNSNQLNGVKTGTVFQELRYCAPPSPVCLNCVKVDFETDEKGVLLNHGSVVKTQWRDLYGLQLSASDDYYGCATGQGPRLFDTSRPGSDTDLGTPNKKCKTGGIGIGSGGETGRSGENCVARKKVLITQDGSYGSSPKPCSKDSKIYFDFIDSKGSDVEYITILNADTSTSIDVAFVDGRAPISKRISDKGANGLERIDLDYTGVKKIRVNMKPGMGIVDIKFCTPCDRDPTPSAIPSTFPSLGIK